MRLLDSNGNVILEREKAKTTRAKTHDQLKKAGIKKTIHPRLMTKDDFFKSILNDSADDNV